MEVSVQFLGSGDAFGSGGRFQPCIHVRCGSESFLLDCGASSMVALRRLGVDPLSIDTILLTHPHGDHFGGVPFFMLDAQLISKRTKPLTVAGPPTLRQRIAEAMEVLFPGSSGVQRKFETEFIELPDGRPVEIGSLAVTAHEVVHASGAPPYALRVECGGKIIGYSGDSEWTDSLLMVSEGADLFICEAYFFDRKIKFRLDYETLMKQRERLGCRRLVVTHMSADMLARLDGVELECAEDEKIITL